MLESIARGLSHTGELLIITEGFAGAEQRWHQVGACTLHKSATTCTEKEANAKALQKSLNFWRTTREKSLSVVTEVTLLVSHAPALGSRHRIPTRTQPSTRPARAGPCERSGHITRVQPWWGRWQVPLCSHTAMHHAFKLCWDHTCLTCASMHSSTLQAYSSRSPSPGNYGNGDYIQLLQN